MVMAGVFTSRKLANAVNEGFFFLSKKPAYQHPTAFILICPGHWLLADTGLAFI